LINLLKTDIRRHGHRSVVLQELLKNAVPYDPELETFLVKFVANANSTGDEEDHSAGLKALASMYCAQKRIEHYTQFQTEVTSALSEIRRQLEFLASLASIQLQASGCQLVPEKEEPAEAFSPQQAYLIKKKNSS
jgi:hypothetical protein